MADSLARKVAQQDDLLSKLDSIAREYDNYNYGLPFGEGNLEQMRAAIDKYDAEALAPMREALQALVDGYDDAISSHPTEFVSVGRAKEFKALVARAAEVLKGVK